MTKIYLNSQLGPISSPDGEKSDEPQMARPHPSRFAQLKQGVLSTVRTHPYLITMTLLAVLAIFKIGKDVFDTMNESQKMNPHPFSTFVCSSCSSTKMYYERASKSPIVAKEIKGLLCSPCDIKAFQAAKENQLLP